MAVSFKSTFHGWKWAVPLLVALFFLSGCRKRSEEFIEYDLIDALKDAKIDSPLFSAPAELKAKVRKLCKSIEARDRDGPAGPHRAFIGKAKLWSHDKSQEFRAALLLSLGVIKAPGGFAVIKRGLRSHKESVRRAATLAVASMRDPDRFESLEARLADKDDSVVHYNANERDNTDKCHETEC